MPRLTILWRRAGGGQPPIHYTSGARRTAFAKYLKVVLRAQFGSQISIQIEQVTLRVLG